MIRNKYLLLATLVMSVGIYSVCEMCDLQLSKLSEEKKMAHQHMHHHKMMSASDHAPIGIMGDMHHSKFMLSLRQEYMHMNGNLLDGKDIREQAIINLPNTVSNMPANLSVVPKEMNMQMTMLGGMYSPSDNITLMAMAMYMSKSMDLKTFKPMMNRDFIGKFKTSSSDLSDLSLSLLYRFNQSMSSRWHLETGLQQSIGENTSKDTVLTPMNQRMDMVLPYGMQPGDDATSVILGLTNVRTFKNGMVWGNQIRNKTVINDKDWAFGDKAEFNSWVQMPLSKSVSISSRLNTTHQDKISGRNILISAPVQTADPRNYGGLNVYLAVGVNLLTSIFSSDNHRFGLEVIFPIDQDKNNLQMKTDYKVIFGYQKSL